MKLREWINRNSELTTIISVFLLVFALVVLVKSIPRGGRLITRCYFYDVVTGKLFSGPVNDLPPVQTPEGSMKNGVFAGVRANVFSCTSCDDASSRKIGYLETLTQEGRDAVEAQRAAVDANLRNSETDNKASVGMTQPAPDDTEMKLMEAISKGRLVALPGDVEKWFTIESEEGNNLVNSAIKSCPDGKYGIQCYPDE